MHVYSAPLQANVVLSNLLPCHLHSFVVHRAVTPQQRVHAACNGVAYSCEGNADTEMQLHRNAMHSFAMLFCAFSVLGTGSIAHADHLLLSNHTRMTMNEKQCPKVETRFSRPGVSRICKYRAWALQASLARKDLCLTARASTHAEILLVIKYLVFHHACQCRA